MAGERLGFFPKKRAWHATCSALGEGIHGVGGRAGPFSPLESLSPSPWARRGGGGGGRSRMRFCCCLWGGHGPGGAASLSRGTAWEGTSRRQAASPSFAPRLFPASLSPPARPSTRGRVLLPEAAAGAVSPAPLNQRLRRQSPAALGDWREVPVQWRAGDPAATALRGFMSEIRRSAELPSVIVPHTIRDRTGNCGAADRYAALIQLSLQPLLAKIRGNWNYKRFLGKCSAPILHDRSAIIHT